MWRRGGYVERTTCYKLCYAVGVSSIDLMQGFVVEHRVSCEFGVFAPGYKARLYRALAALYNHVMHNYYSYADTMQFSNGVSEFFQPYFIETSYDPVIARGNRTLLEYLQEVVELHNEIAADAFEEMEIGIPREIFIEITRLPILDRKSAAQVAFLMSKISRIYGIYFFGKELLNVATGSMLQDDLALRDRLSLCFGGQFPSIKDTSALSHAVSDYLSKVFIDIYDKSSMYRLAVVDGIVESATMKSAISKCMRRYKYIKHVLSAEDLKSGDLCITSCAEFAIEAARQRRDVSFALVLPIESRYYKHCRRRVEPNIYMISQK